MSFYVAITGDDVRVHCMTPAERVGGQLRVDVVVQGRVVVNGVEYEINKSFKAPARRVRKTNEPRPKNK